MNRPLTAALAVTVSLLAAQTASADTKSWTAIKKVVGKGDAIVVGIDLVPLRSTAAFKQGLQMFLQEEDEARAVFDAIRSDCGFDITTAVSDLTVVMQRDGEEPLLAFGLDGVDEPKVMTCMGLVGAKMAGVPPVTLKAKKVGKLTEYTVPGEKQKLYVAWLAKDVLVFSEDINDKAKLTRRLGGKGLAGDLKKHLGKASTSSPFWFAVAMKEREDGRTILGGYGKADVVGPLVKLSGALVFSRPAEAADFVREGNAALIDVHAELAKGSVKELAAAVKTVTITANGSEAQMSGQVPDKDIAVIVPQLDKAF